MILEELITSTPQARALFSRTVKDQTSYDHGRHERDKCNVQVLNVENNSMLFNTSNDSLVCSCTLSQQTFQKLQVDLLSIRKLQYNVSAILLSVISRWVTLLFSLAPEMFFFPIPSLHFSFGVTHLPKLYLNSECRLSDDFCLIIVSLSVSQELTLQWETESLRPRRLLQTWPWLIFTPWGELRRQIYLYSSLDMK